eukprot:CAMPEP_0182425912 /NCGR_PEP_ID=MMETSP1167-20130531/12398_1 /TAXON_ID=2988 /ORGANISM="Mallomonas Sp, Strain CCMP3275" /LENGTH=325 /DNA_ID=CAMNT_0024606987 /DNA_START=204 /DNA_END=1181 /DNA_ORIENTATION=-
MAVVKPGEPMNDGDELWPCGGSRCPHDTDFTASTVPYKMVFYNGNVFLFARARVTELKYWTLTFAQVLLNVIGAQVSDWGEPYWNLYDDYTSNHPLSEINSFDPAYLLENNARRLSYRVRYPESSSPQPLIVFQNTTLETYFDRQGNLQSRVVTKDVFIMPSIRSVWGCDMVEFMMLTDGNLVLTTLQNTSSPFNIPNDNIQCKVAFSSGPYKDLGGTTNAPSMEPTPKPSVSFEPTHPPTPQPSLFPTTSMLPTGLPTTPLPTPAPSLKPKNNKNAKSGKNKRRRNRRRKNRKKNRNKNKVQKSQTCRQQFQACKAKELFDEEQ